MRHQDREAAVGGRQPGDAKRRAVDVERIALGCPAGAVDVAQCHIGLRRRELRGVPELRVTLTVGRGHRNATARHAGEEQAWRAPDLDQREARLELLGAIAQEAWPVLGAGNEGREVGEHLAAVADAECEASRIREETLERRAQGLAMEDGLRPAPAGSEHIAVGKAAAGRQTLETAECQRA